MTEAELHPGRTVARHPRIRREIVPTTVLDPDQRSSKVRGHSVRRRAPLPYCASSQPVHLAVTKPWSGSKSLIYKEGGARAEIAVSDRAAGSNEHCSGRHARSPAPCAL